MTFESQRHVLVTVTTGQRGRPGRADTMQRPPAINRHAAPKRMLVHSRPLVMIVSGCLILQLHCVVNVAPVAAAPAGSTKSFHVSMKLNELENIGIAPLHPLLQ